MIINEFVLCESMEYSALLDKIKNTDDNELKIATKKIINGTGTKEDNVNVADFAKSNVKDPSSFIKYLISLNSSESSNPSNSNEKLTAHEIRSRIASLKDDSVKLSRKLSLDIKDELEGMAASNHSAEDIKQKFKDIMEEKFGKYTDDFNNVFPDNDITKYHEYVHKQITNFLKRKYLNQP